MAKGILKKILLPKEEKFFPLFENQADLILEAAKIMDQILESPDPAGELEKFKHIKDLEKQADELAHQVFDLLDTTFITPFDREDIHQLVSKMDDLLDFLNAASQQIKLYRPKKIAPQMKELKEMIVLIVQGCEQMKIACQGLHNLKKPEKISQACIRINELENAVDEIYHQLLTVLFSREKDAIELIKKKGILETLESTADAIEDVSDIMKTIIIKSA